MKRKMTLNSKMKRLMKLLKLLKKSLDNEDKIVIRNENDYPKIF
jgi:hypothetical protein